MSLGQDGLCTQDRPAVLCCATQLLNALFCPGTLMSGRCLLSLAQALLSLWPREAAQERNGVARHRQCLK